MFGERELETTSQIPSEFSDEILYIRWSNFIEFSLKSEIDDLIYEITET